MVSNIKFGLYTIYSPLLTITFHCTRPTAGFNWVAAAVQNRDPQVASSVVATVVVAASAAAGSDVVAAPAYRPSYQRS